MQIYRHVWNKNRNKILFLNQSETFKKKTQVIVRKLLMYLKNQRRKIRIQTFTLYRCLGKIINNFWFVL